MPACRVHARAPRLLEHHAVQTDPDLVRAFLEDAAHVPGGVAAGVAFPRTEDEVAAVVASAATVLPVGAQSSLTGGATPRGEVVLSTRALTGIELLGGDRVRVGAGVPVAELQRTLASYGLYYPPAPTYDGAFIGGTIATNAAGAATFKYGSTRDWVAGLTIVLASGDIVDLTRGDARPEGHAFEIAYPGGAAVRVPLPTYRAPAVPKHSGGYAPSSAADVIDLFVGSEGTLGIIVSAIVRVIARPEITLALFACESDAQAIGVTAALRAGEGGDVAGVEYIDDRAIALLDDDVFRRAGVTRPPRGAVLLLVQVQGDIEPLTTLLDRWGLAERAAVAMSGDTRAAACLLELREAVPAAVNRLVADAKTRVSADIEKTAGDMIVPFDRLADSLALYRSVLDRYGLHHAIWGHFSDGNLHPNVIPRSLDDVRKGKDALLEIGREVAAMGGSPLAEHGVGRNPVKQALLRQLYGPEGIAEMRAVKKALDPSWKLAPGVLFPP